MKTVLAALALTASLGLIAAVGAAPGKPFKVASTLDGKTVLPHRIHWIALPTLAPSDIKRVEFAIDGRVAWVEHGTPYVYSNDEGPRRGYLVTSFLTPGKHRFAVKAYAVDGRTATDTVVARVLPNPDPPAQLAGTWTRVVDTADAPKPKSAGNPTETLTPSGKYSLTFDRRWIQDLFPCTTTPCRFVSKTGAGQGFVSDWTPGAKTFTVRGPVTFRIAHDNDRIAGWWCWMDGPDATYTWSVSGDTLTLAPVGGHDACGIRGFIWTGQWSRTG